MECSDFEPKGWDMDKKAFEQVSICFTDVSTEDLHRITEAVEGLTGEQAEAPVEDAEEEADEDETDEDSDEDAEDDEETEPAGKPSDDEDTSGLLSGKIIDALKELERATPGAVTRTIYNKSNYFRGASTGVRKLMKKMADEDLLVAQPTPGGATYYTLPEE